MPARFEATDTHAGAVLPADIVRALSSDARVLDCQEGTYQGASRFAPDWVIARRVDLDDDGRDDWVVQGRHRCLATDGAADWWLYADDGSQRRLLLAAGRARVLELQATRANGFRDVVLHRDGGDVRATYQGGAYVFPEQPRTGANAGGGPTLAAARFAAPTGGGPMDVQTVAGRLEIAPVEGTTPGDAHVVRLDGRELLRTGAGGAFADFPLPRLLARFGALAPFDEVLVFQQHMYGNACSGGPLWILGLRRGGAPVRSTAIDYCGGADPELEARGAALLVTLPGAPASGVHAGQAPQRWEFSDGELRRLHTP
ncbi:MULTISPECIES: hypothetical protein [unclassified Luteimonas]|uniref:hypothetical protein n=1 Tax=unclassified Luteimonas TaxID=2629088 RepID=UPI0018F082B3|nr:MULTISPECIES: hypothetical protein [unclassified Luteimonas]MBJ6981806.1 hypothetical protein [Luteimonas sp. MC1572]MBJ7575633.1 hypothetical protein [Luteimonas sp. MC1828]QQO03089.1 hypothetical protein JGR64_13190 [Luteimonas sp. MC1572]